MLIKESNAYLIPILDFTFVYINYQLISYIFELNKISGCNFKITFDYSGYEDTIYKFGFKLINQLFQSK